MLAIHNKDTLEAVEKSMYHVCLEDEDPKVGIDQSTIRHPWKEINGDRVWERGEGGLYVGKIT